MTMLLATYARAYSTAFTRAVELRKIATVMYESARPIDAKQYQKACAASFDADRACEAKRDVLLTYLQGITWP